MSKTTEQEYNWSFIDQYIDLQAGKRLFSLFNAVTFLGDACGSGLLSFVMHRMGFEGMTALYMTLIALSMPVVVFISRKIEPLLEAHLDHAKSKTTLSFKEIFNKVFQSRFTLALLGFYFVMQLLAIVAEFNYMSRFDNLLGSGQEHQLTEFLGRINMWIGLGNMLLGLFFYSRMVRRTGVQNLAVIAPAFFFFLFCVWFWQDGLSLAILGLIGREGMVYTFDDNNLNLLISGVPSKIKNQIRITVESFFEPVGMLFGASLLCFFQQTSLTLGLSISVVACIMVFLLRHEYPKAIFSNLVASSIHFGKTALDWIPKHERKSFEFHLLASLKRPDEASRLLAFEYLLKMGNEHHLSRLLNQINLLSIPGKIKAIELLCDSKWATQSVVVERLDRWRRVLPHPSIKSAIHFYFARHSLLRPERIIHDLQEPHVGMRAAAILSLKTTPFQTQLPSLHSLASDKLKELLDSKIESELIVGLEILGREGNPDNMRQLIAHLQYPSFAIKRCAAKAIACLASPASAAHSSTLIQYLAHNRESEITQYLIKALEKMAAASTLPELLLASIHFKPAEKLMVHKMAIAMPAIEIAPLLDMLKNKYVHERCRLMAGKILARVNNALLRQHLFEIVQSEVERAYFYHYHVDTVSEKDQPILKNALETGYHNVIDFIIQLIGAADNLEECDVLSHTLRSKNQKLRAQALETLQKACSLRLFAILEPLVDERSSEKKLRNFIKRGFTPLKLHQLLDTMAFSPSLTDQIVAIWLKAKLNTPDWKEIVRKKLENNEEIFRHFAEELLEEKYENAQPN